MHPPERCVLDQRLGRTADVKLGRDAAKEIVHLPRGVTREAPRRGRTRDVPPPAAPQEPRVPHHVAVHGQSILLVLATGHEPRGLS